MEDERLTASGRGGGRAPAGASNSWHRGGRSLARGVRVREHLVLRMLEDGRAVTKAKARGLAPAGASESGVWQPGWRLGGGRRVGGGRGIEVSVRRVSGRWWVHRSGAVAVGMRVMAMRI
jgi:hypothetical protein